MDENAQSFSPSYSQPDSHQPKQTNRLRPSASKAKSRPASHLNSPAVYQDVELQERKIPRPIKLKPLKEVLTKLITQLKKKDDYAFFLRPVDAVNVPGYSDIVKRPMDLGTMSVKVSRGKYRSLEEFASDFWLVTNNAKMFNPPGSIYYTEADKLEIWGLEHIAKASSTVIQYETDWNIDVEEDDDATPVNIDGDDDDNTNAPTPMDVDLASLRERSTSVVSQVPQVPGPSSRRGPRGPYRKQGQSAAAPGTLSETLEPDGGLPGSKDGLGAFPSGSDWAKTMLALKLKGKRYKTKKERLRIEREGPPLHPDGSLDYTEMEDPFSVLSFFVPDPPTRPHLVPLYPPLFNSAGSSSSYPAQAPPPSAISQSHSQSQQDPSSSHTPRSHLSPGPTSATTTTASASAIAPVASSSSAPPFPGATSVSLDHPSLSIPFLQQLQFDNDSYGKQKQKQGGYVPQSSQAATSVSSLKATARKRRHWTIVRNASSYRQKGKEREDYYSYDFTQDPLVGSAGLDPLTSAVPGASWKAPREAQAVDFGSFSVLAGALAEEMQRRFGSETVTAQVPSTTATTSTTAGYPAYSTFSAVPTAPLTPVVSSTAGASITGIGTGGASGVAQGAATTSVTDQMKPGTRTDQEVTFDLIRESLDCERVAKTQNQIESHGESQSALSGTGVGVGAEDSKKKRGKKKDKGKADGAVHHQHANGPSASGTSAKAAEYYFTTQRAAEAEEYLRDLVYGGLEGFAYVRSLAEFVDEDCYYKSKGEEDLETEIDTDMDIDIDEKRKSSEDHPYNPTLGMPLAQWVVQNIVDPLTEGRHSLLRQAALELARQQAHAPNASRHPLPHQYPPGSVAAQVHASLHLYPAALLALSALVQIRLHKIDMGSLIKTPNELFLSEEEWFGKTVKERRREKSGVMKEKEQVKVEESTAIAGSLDAMEVEEEEEEEPELTSANVDTSVKVTSNGVKNGSSRPSMAYEQEGPEELREVLDYVANLIVEADKRNRGTSASTGGVNGHSAATTKFEDREVSTTTTQGPQSSSTSTSTAQGVEDPLIRNLRLNLLALAKRAPLDTIARLPKDLVPEHIRHFVPTLGSTT
ncbi:hypothetical protein CPB84DRAFT_1847085 [Gymnopilus junonius]|uniref:Bromo domain-containing protein n=1 Tax=Gymnopilus junonius TaxID=109634 RepID=A0A9P5NPL2_GYMJU|nr:hypothetical protein CPB84DRAFT_1847085 [Gymnopilus junonius]